MVHIPNSVWKGEIKSKKGENWWSMVKVDCITGYPVVFSCYK